jgi:hypothetical protein
MQFTRYNLVFANNHVSDNHNIYCGNKVSIKSRLKHIIILELCRDRYKSDQNLCHLMYVKSVNDIIRYVSCTD